MYSTVQYTFTRVHARIPNVQPREDPRAEVGEDVRVGVGVGPMEFKLNRYSANKVLAGHRRQDSVWLRPVTANPTGTDVVFVTRRYCSHGCYP